MMVTTVPNITINIPVCDILARVLALAATSEA